MLYIACIVFSDHHGEVAYTWRTALCNACITNIRPYLDNIESWAHARAHRTWDADVTCQGGVPMKLLMRIQGRYSLNAAVPATH